MEKRKVLVIGAGRTGRGMLGQMFYAEGGYNLTFADNDAALVAGLRAQGYYTAERKGLLSGEISRTRVDGYTVLHTVADHEEYINAIAEAQFVMTALFPEAFDQVAKDMAEGIQRRVQRGLTHPAAFMLGANFVGLYGYYHPRILAALDSAGRAHFEKHIALVGTNANRKVVYPATYGKDKYFLTGDDKPVLAVNNSFKFPAGFSYPGFFRRTDNLEMYMVEKIWTANLDHCSFGFMGNYYGHTTINQAVRSEHIRRCAYHAWLEGRKAVQAEYGLAIPAYETKREEYQKFASPYFEDAIARIGRNPMRKLAKNDRFIGPALLCLKHGITPWFILRCASYGFYYNDENDAPAVQLRQMLRTHGIDETIRQVCGLNPDIAAEKTAFAMLKASYQELGGNDPVPLEG